MDQSNHSGVLWISRWVSKRIRTLSSRSDEKLGFDLPSTFVRHRNCWIALGLIVMAGVFGCLAHTVTQGEAIYRWERQHIPDLKSLEALVTSVGFQNLGRQKVYEKILRQFPMGHDEFGSIWASSDLNWVGYYPTSEYEEQPHLYCRECLKIPENWDFWGVGWVSLEGLLNEIRKKPAGPSSSSKSPGSKRPLERDPREIVY